MLKGDVGQLSATTIVIKLSAVSTDMHIFAPWSSA